MRPSPSIRLLALLAILSTLPLLAHQELGHEPRPDLSPDVPEAELQKAREAGKALGKDLMGHLSRELKAGGMQSALEVCSKVAPKIAAEHSSETTTVRRVSLKPRNPADRPDPWERNQLMRFEALHTEDDLPTEMARVMETDSGSVLRWMKPIKIQGLCLNCHGDRKSFDADLRAKLDDLYPEDKATGYRSGDLRGAVSVTIQLDASNSTTEDDP